MALICVTDEDLSQVQISIESFFEVSIEREDIDLMLITDSALNQVNITMEDI